MGVRGSGVAQVSFCRSEGVGRDTWANELSGVCSGRVGGERRIGRWGQARKGAPYSGPTRTLEGQISVVLALP